jgi:hypothetical protein
MTYTTNMERAVLVLNDNGSDAIIERIVLAAARALDALEHGDVTPDGDATSMTARTILRTAFMDTEAITKGI